MPHHTPLPINQTFKFKILDYAPLHWNCTLGQVSFHKKPPPFWLLKLHSHPHHAVDSWHADVSSLVTKQWSSVKGLFFNFLSRFWGWQGDRALSVHQFWEHNDGLNMGHASQFKTRRNEIGLCPFIDSEDPSNNGVRLWSFIDNTMGLSSDVFELHSFFDSEGPLIVSININK